MPRVCIYQHGKALVVEEWKASPPPRLLLDGVLYRAHRITHHRSPTDVDEVTIYASHTLAGREESEVFNRLFPIPGGIFHVEILR